MTSRLSYFLGASILLHLLLVGVVSLAFRQVLPFMRPEVAPPPAPPRLTMLKIQEAPKRAPVQFIPTLASQTVAKADPSAVLESERNTALQSDHPGRIADSPLPDMTGSPKAGFNYLNTPASPLVKSQPSPPHPPAETAAPAVPAPAGGSPVPAAPTKAETPNPIPSKSTTILPTATDTVPILPPPPDASKPQDKTAPTPFTQSPSPAPPQETKPAPEQPQTKAAPSPASPPPSETSFHQERSDTSGGLTPKMGEPSPASKETEVGRYKARVYRAIGSRWYISTERNMTLLGIGELRVKFFVRSNGTIDQVSVLSSSGKTDILETISRKAIQDSQPFEVFTDSLKEQLGEGYWEEITFAIY